MHGPLLICLAILAISGLPIQKPIARTRNAGSYAIIQRTRTVLVRGPELARQFPNRKRAIVSYPKISGLNSTILRRVRALLDYKNIFDYSLDEYRNDAWLTEFSFVVNHNSDYLLDITFTQIGVAAYPDEQSKHFLINLRDGTLIQATDAFEVDKLQELAALVNKKLQAEIEQRKKDEAKSATTDPDQKASLNDAYELLKFEVKELDDFSVSEKGITFLYDAGFPHVIKALEPGGRYFFNYRQLKPYIKPDGPLGQFIVRV